MTEQTDSYLPNQVVVIQASKHRTVMPMRADDGVWVKGLDWYWKVHPVCGVPALCILPNPTTGLLEYRVPKALGRDPVMALVGQPVNDNEGWTEMKKLVAEIAILLIVVGMMVSWQIAWVFNFAPQLGGFEIGGTKIYLPLQYAFWELHPKDHWIQMVGHVVMVVFAGLGALRFWKGSKRIIRPFNEGQMGDIKTASKKGLTF